jgi:hypothetical protein
VRLGHARGAVPNQQLESADDPGTESRGGGAASSILHCRRSVLFYVCIGV